MRNYLQLCVVAALATLLTTFSSCKKEVALSPLPEHALLDSITWFNQNQTNFFVYDDDGAATMELHIGNQTSVLRTDNPKKTFWAFTITDLGAENFQLSFQDIGTLVRVGENGNAYGGYFPPNMDWKITTPGQQAFSITELDGVYRVTKIGTHYELRQVSGKHTPQSPLVFYFHE